LITLLIFWWNEQVFKIPERAKKLYHLISLKNLAFINSERSFL
jgi:hypothetical protein